MADDAEARRKAMFAAWTATLPPEECTYTITPVRVPMPDGVRLAADLYQPSAPYKSRGLILTFGCYGRGPPMSTMNATVFAARGYTVLLTSSRGTFGSEGAFVPGMSEQVDSQGIVAWVRGQDWYPGKFATFGASYLGYTQWALLRDPPPDLVCCAILAAPHDHAVHNWTEGAYRLDRLTWTNLIVTQEDPKSNGPDAAASNRQVSEIMKATPLLDAAEGYFAGRAPYLRDFMKTPGLSDPLWAPVRHGDALDKVNVPVLLTSGWYDPFTYQSMEQYQRLQARGCDVSITVGPWSHLAACGLHSMPEIFAFLNQHLVGEKDVSRAQPVKVFTTGAEEWREMPVWPPATKPVTFFLDGDSKGITKNSPAADSPTLSFTFDPADPTPTIGGGLLHGTGRVEDTAYASREDLLVYTSEPLTEAVEVMGRPVVHLAHSTDVPYVDLWVRLSEVDAAGSVSKNVTEFYKALDIKRGDDVTTITLQDCAHLYKPGSRIRLIVAGGSFPLMARNPGVEGLRTLAKEFKSVTHSVRHGVGVSKLVLPCSIAS